MNLGLGEKCQTSHVQMTDIKAKNIKVMIAFLEYIP